MEAVESSIPLYESISEAISLWLAGPLRRRAISWLVSTKEWTLDLGAGPGVSSELLVSRGFFKVVALDPSLRLLKFARSAVGDDVYPVMGVSESLPFKVGAFEAVLTCFALRDVRDVVESLKEISRVSRPEGRFAVVDVGKPGGGFRRNLAWLYIRFIMPLIAQLLIWQRIPRNPFRMIISTYRDLLTNDRLRNLIRREFGPSKLQEYLFGGLVVVEACKSQPETWCKAPGSLDGHTRSWESRTPRPGVGSVWA